MAKPEKPLKDILNCWVSRQDPPEWPFITRERSEGIHRFEFSTWSQNGEDGILRHLVQLLPGIPRTFVEIGFHATECNCIRLALRHGFSGVFFDADQGKCTVTNHAAEAHGIPVKAKRLWVDRENILPAMKREGVKPRFGVLSVDIDGNDLWVMESILKNFTCDIVVVEYNASFGDYRSVSVPYKKDFDRKGGIYHGASIKALDKIAQREGYCLVGCDFNGINAFFVNQRHRTFIDVFSPEHCWRPHSTRIKHKTQEQQEQRIFDCHYPIDV